jgi:RNA 2',3'-cyclic 3'-phosphodiesterase
MSGVSLATASRCRPSQSIYTLGCSCYVLGMSLRASNPAHQTEIPVGLFFAIFPDPPAAALIARVARHLRRRYRLRGGLHLTERFHSTLYGFRGDEGPAPLLVEKAKVAAANVVVPPFRVAFNRAGSFANKKDDYPFVLMGEDGVVGLLMLYRSLCMELRRVGLRPKASSNFTPHVTLFYDRRRIDEQTIEPIYWTVRKLILVLSLRGRTEYVSLGEWPLRG